MHEFSELIEPSLATIEQGRVARQWRMIAATPRVALLLGSFSRWGALAGQFTEAGTEVVVQFIYRHHTVGFGLFAVGSTFHAVQKCSGENAMVCKIERRCKPVVRKK